MADSYAKRTGGGRPSGVRAASHGVRRPSASQRMYLTIWTRQGAEPLERRGVEAELVPEFHRLREEGCVYQIELGNMDVNSHVAWLSWRNPGAAAAAKTCPHCGGAL